MVGRRVGLLVGFGVAVFVAVDAAVSVFVGASVDVAVAVFVGCGAVGVGGMAVGVAVGSITATAVGAAPPHPITNIDNHKKTKIRPFKILCVLFDLCGEPKFSIPWTPHSSFFKFA